MQAILNLKKFWAGVKRLPDEDKSALWSVAGITVFAVILAMIALAP